MSISSRLRKAGAKVTKADARIVRAVAPQPGGVAEKIAGTLGKMGDQPELRTLSAIAIAGGLLSANRRLLRAGIRMLLAHELATLGKNMVKDEFDRTRPHSARSDGQRKVKPGHRSAKSETSFPSGHSAGSMAVARALGREYPGQQVPALAAAAVVGGLQVPRLNHYPTDVMAGMLVGVVSEAAANLVFAGDDEDDLKLEAPLPPPHPV
jgi:membrane-associated phospholipid phosphatase